MVGEDVGFGGEELFKPIIAIFSALKGHPADQSTNQLELFYPQSYLDNSVYHSGLVLFKLSLLCSCFWPVLDQLDFTFPHWTPQRQLKSFFLNWDRETAKYRKTEKKVKIKID